MDFYVVWIVLSCYLAPTQKEKLFNLGEEQSKACKAGDY